VSGYEHDHCTRREIELEAALSTSRAECEEQSSRRVDEEMRAERAEAECEELRRDVVFCARNAIEFFITTTGPCIGRFYTVTYTRGTDDEVTAAVRQARQKGE
jgi:hypothetical protein